MPSVVDICNEAMDLLGAATITALTENSKEARLCNRRFVTVRDSVLRTHTWNVAVTRATLAQDTDPPAFGFTYQYSLPTDPYCLRVLSFWNSNVNNDVAAYDSNVMFKIEGRKVLSNEGTCSIIYISSLYLGAEESVYIVPSMGASAVLLFAVPQSALRQLWNLIG